MKKTGGGGGKGHTSKHAGSHKHHAHGAKHHPKHQPAHHHHAAHHQPVHVKGKHPHHGRGLAVGDLLPVCSLEAVAMSLRLAGQPVGDDEVAWLWELCGSRELSIAEALAAFGVADPGQVTCAGLAIPDHHSLILGVDIPGPHAVLATPDGWWSWGQLWTPWTTAVSEAWAVSWT